MTLPLPTGVDSQMISTETGLNQHVLTAGDPNAPMVLLLHGFPELAYSWRRILPGLAEAGYYAVAPDQRGYGRTTGWDQGYDVDLWWFSMPSLVRDALGLIRALGRDQVDAVVGHDFGSPVAAWAGLLRPDVFRSVACLSAPFGGPPAPKDRIDPTHADLAALDQPRKHYQWYYSTPEANPDMINAVQGFRAFLHAYFHMKSADWTQNQPYSLERWDAENLAQLPTYYVMNADQDMAATVVAHTPQTTSDWLTSADLDVYAAEFLRTGLQGGLNWYRCATSSHFRRALSVFHGQVMEVPLTFIAGRQDWGWAQVPGALERMETCVCRDYRGTHLVHGAGHWVQQEQPFLVLERLKSFIASIS